jgi:prolipoprotein diacylglyceryltransferase
MELLIFLAGPAILATGLFTKDSFITWFGVGYIALFVVAYFTGRYNARRTARERAALIERHYDQLISRQKENIDR